MIHGLVTGTISGAIKSTDKYTAGRITVKAGTDVLTVGFIAFAADIRAALDGLTAGEGESNRQRRELRKEYSEIRKPYHQSH